MQTTYAEQFTLEMYSRAIAAGIIPPYHTYNALTQQLTIMACEDSNQLDKQLRMIAGQVELGL